MHLADAFIQSDLQCIQAIHVFFLYHYVYHYVTVTHKYTVYIKRGMFVLKENSSRDLDRRLVGLGV